MDTETDLRRHDLLIDGKRLPPGTRDYSVNINPATEEPIALVAQGSAQDVDTVQEVQILTATHPIDPEPRRLGWEYAEPVTIGDNVWLGAGAIVCPGVTIGAGTVVGAGAVVTRDLPSDIVAVGAPARVLRRIGDRDRLEIPDR